MTTDTALAHRHAVRTLVQAFERAEQRVRGAFAEIVAAEDEQRGIGWPPALASRRSRRAGLLRLGAATR